jgi:hypothetical protein
MITLCEQSSNIFSTSNLKRPCPNGLTRNFFKIFVTMYQERTIPQRNLRDATIHRAAKRDTCEIQVSMPQLHGLEPSVPTLAPHHKKT